MWSPNPNAWFLNRSIQVDIQATWLAERSLFGLASLGKDVRALPAPRLCFL